MRRVVAALFACLSCASVSAQEPYKLPPRVIVDILDTPPARREPHPSPDNRAAASGADHRARAQARP